jgi:hypothetical protein
VLPERRDPPGLRVPVLAHPDPGYVIGVVMDLPAVLFAVIPDGWPRKSPRSSSSYTHR